MSADFRIVAENPNHAGGCLCDEQGTKDTRPPYASFFTQEMESILSPTPVICGRCLEALRDEYEDYEAEHGPEV